MTEATNDVGGDNASQNENSIDQPDSNANANSKKGFFREIPKKIYNIRNLMKRTNNSTVTSDKQGTDQTKSVQREDDTSRGNASQNPALVSQQSKGGKRYFNLSNFNNFLGRNRNSNANSRMNGNGNVMDSRTDSMDIQENDLPMSNSGEELNLASQRKQNRLNKFYQKIFPKKQENPASNMFYRKHTGIFLILLSLTLVVLSVFARFGPEDEKPEYLVALIILFCLLFILQLLLFVSMNYCPKRNKGAIGCLFTAGIGTIISLILASIAKYRMDNDEEEENITTAAMVFSFCTFILSIVFVPLINYEAQ